MIFEFWRVMVIVFGGIAILGYMYTFQVGVLIWFFFHQYFALYKWLSVSEEESLKMEINIS